MRVISIDLPGHGYSMSYGDVHTMEFMARAVKAVLDDAEVDKCVMLGHSMGGYVALAFAEMYPYQLKGLGLMHSHALSDNENICKAREAVCQQMNVNRASYIVNFIPSLFCEKNRVSMAAEIKDLQDQCLETSAQSIIAAQRGMAKRPNRLSVLQKLSVPLLYILGKQDNRIDVDLAVAQAMVAPEVELYILENVGHMSLIESREKVKGRIKAFVETCYN